MKFDRLYRDLFVLAMLLPLAMQAQVTLAGYWKFDEAPGATTVIDSSGNGLNGTLSGTSPTFVGGMAGNALSLTAGHGDLANMGNVLGMTGTSFSVSFWMNTSLGGTYSILGKHQQGSVAGWLFSVGPSAGYGAADKVWFNASGPSGSTSPTSTTSVNNGNWHHVVATRTDTNNYLYVDGSLQATTGTDSIASVAASFLVGGEYSSSGTTLPYYTGLIDDLQVYTGALSGAQVSYLYTNPGSAIPESSTYAVLAGLVALGAAGWRRRRILTSRESSGR